VREGGERRREAIQRRVGVGDDESASSSSVGIRGPSRQRGNPESLESGPEGPSRSDRGQDWTETATPTACYTRRREVRRAVLFCVPSDAEKAKKKTPANPSAVSVLRVASKLPFPFPAISVSCSARREQWASQRGLATQLAIWHTLSLHIPARDERP
jgi:hypothetical protein